MNTISPKVATTAIAGAAVAIIVWAAGQWGHVTIPPDISAALTTIVGAVVGYSTPHPS